MKAITCYEPPAPHQLEVLKHHLQETGRGMATLAGLSGDNQWRKYTGGKQPRQASLHLAFFMAARLELDDSQLEQIYERMRAMGCGLEFSESISSPTPTPA